MSESEKRVSDEIDVEDVEPIDPLSLLQQNQIDPATELLLQAWIWHMLLPLGGQLDFIGDHGFEDMNVANLLKAHLWFETEDEYEPIAARAQLKRHYMQWQQHIHWDGLYEKGVPNVLKANIAAWQELLGLNATESKILTFVILLYHHNVLNQAAQLMGELNSRQVVLALSVILQLPEADVREALGHQQTLFHTGLLKVDHSSEYPLRSKIDLMSGYFATWMCLECISPVELLKRHVHVAPNTELALDDFAHLGTLVPALRHYVPKVMSQQQAGCNILIYGVAGTGKTEFTRALAQELGLECIEVAWADDEGNPANREARMSALRAAQHIFAKQNILLLFDEVEDVFNTEQKDYQLNKAWLNRMLEQNAVPTVWITNRVDMMDRAALRRFDMVIEMKAPPRAKRREMIARLTKGFLNAAEVEQLAEHEDLVPAMLERAHKVTEQVAEVLSAAEQAVLYKQLLHSTLKAQGISSYLNRKNDYGALYDVAWINTHHDLQQLSQGLANHAVGSLCLYGPPGTGKSAYVKWLARQLGRPLLYKKGSDLLSKYVGESERLIAEAFEEAIRDDAILIFDEVDSFLQDRRQAHQSWEVTQVNEMLTQMEAFQGIFVATTNLMKHLDQAALRRFDFKIEFGFLRLEQRWQLFQAYCQHFGLACPHSLEYAVGKLHVLTPGDFAVVVKCSRITPIQSAEQFLQLLQAECALKEQGSKTALGFM
ncbi:AAA family ATPase [Vitreoscilla stercoraria]|uniref:ATP-binding protein n=1 Tax=Vitreoscilla stercoraria TaxID=61 RepID=A0ABY4E837_VITST|nr:ATP-binding protein [Vitreoscilla stercoraria]UOO91921.1 ATP-binding protein [Vitreoscilla stercoraria]